MIVKALATGAAAAAAIGALAVGVTSGPSAAFSVQSVAFDTPLPLDPPPAADLPTPEQLSSLCNQVTDPGVSYTTKQNLVENGISSDEGTVADHDLRKAFRHGNFPEQFDVTNIASPTPNVATADVAISGPKFAGPLTKNLAFVNQGGNWIMQHDAAIALIQAATATN